VIAVTLDTSFYIGALNSRGGGSRLLSMALAGEVRVDISEPIVTETLRVLRKTFGWDGYRINHLKQTLSRITNQVAPEQTLDVIKEDPSDNRILECAAEAGSDYIVTWDKDLLRLERYGKARIVTVPVFLRLVASVRES
jgi:putative PIN family toxin of toxin-antitoxin system